LKTYPAEVIRKALYSLIDREKYVRFSMYMQRGRPYKVKAKFCWVHCTPEGLKLGFNECFIGRKIWLPSIEVPVRNIRWLTSPFDEKKFEEKCQEYMLKLTEGKRNQIT